MARNRVVIVSKGTGISNWPELARGFVTIDEHSDLTSTLSRLADAASDWRKALAGRALEAATSFNNDNIARWEQLLLRTAKRAAL